MDQLNQQDTSASGQSQPASSGTTVIPAGTPSSAPASIPTADNSAAGSTSPANVSSDTSANAPAVALTGESSGNYSSGTSNALPGTAPAPMPIPLEPLTLADAMSRLDVDPNANLAALSASSSPSTPFLDALAAANLSASGAQPSATNAQSDADTSTAVKSADHKGILHGLFEELEHIESLGKSEIVAIIKRAKSLI